MAYPSALVLPWVQMDDSLDCSIRGSAQELALRDSVGWCWMPIPEALLEARHKGHLQLWPSMKRSKKMTHRCKSQVHKRKQIKWTEASRRPVSSHLLLFATAVAFLAPFAASQTVLPTLSVPRRCTFGDLWQGSLQLGMMCLMPMMTLFFVRKQAQHLQHPSSERYCRIYPPERWRGRPDAGTVCLSFI